jgi:hypothetical protein
MSGHVPAQHSGDGDTTADVRLLHALFHGRADDAAACFAGDPDLCALPSGGRVRGAAFAEAVAAWPRWFSASGDVAITRRFRTTQRNRVVTEVWASLPSFSGGTVDLPIAISSETAPGGVLTRARVYFCSKPVRGALNPRPTSFPHHGHFVSAIPEDVPDINAEYFRNQIVDWNVDGMVRAYDRDGYIERGTDRIDGREGMLEYYGAFPAPASGGLTIVVDNTVYDGRNCAVEWSAPRTEPFTTSGLAVYERAENRFFAANRQYDDSIWPQLGE